MLMETNEGKQLAYIKTLRSSVFAPDLLSLNAGLAQPSRGPSFTQRSSAESTPLIPAASHPLAGLTSKVRQGQEADGHGV